MGCKTFLRPIIFSEVTRMSVIQITGLTFAYEGSYDNIFEDVSFSLDTDWRLGFVGRNGRGKTTFLKLLMGEHEYLGSISSTVGFDYFPFPVPDPDRMTGELLEEVAPDSLPWQVGRELSLLGVDEEVLYRPFSTLSNGEQTKVLLAGLFLKENNFLLIDEPTNHLDGAARALVSKYLRSKKGFIMVSHDRMFLDGCIDHVLAINKANIEVQKGNFSSWWQNRQLQDQYEADENLKLQKDVKRLAEAAGRTSRWSDKVERSKIGAYDKGYVGHKSAKMMKRAKAIEARQEKALEDKSKLLKNLEKNEQLLLHPLQYHTGRLAELEDISIQYGSKVACQGVSFQVRQGERVALTGPNGCGKTSILRLFTEEKGQGAFTGSLWIGNGLKVSYIPQDTAFLTGDLREFARTEGLDESLFKTILRKLDFSRLQFEKDMADYSGGQKKKVLLAKSLCESAHLYVWDEPLNYIDVLSRIQIEALILEFQPTLLFVEHDRAFCEKIATITIAL